MDWQRPREEASREVEPGDLPGAVAVVVERCEQIGDANVRLLALEDRLPAVRYLLEQGRESHRQWVERVFARFLPTRRNAAYRRRYRDRFITDPAPLYAADTLDAIDAVSPDVIVPEYTIFGAHIAAQKRGLPVAAVVPNIWPLPAPGAPPFGPGFLPARSILGRTRDALFRRLVTSIFDDALPALNEMRRQHGLPPLSAFFDQVLQCDALVVRTSAAFDFTSPFRTVCKRIGPLIGAQAWRRYRAR